MTIQSSKICLGLFLEKKEESPLFGPPKFFFFCFAFPKNKISEGKNKKIFIQKNSKTGILRKKPFMGFLK